MLEKIRNSGIAVWLRSLYSRLEGGALPTFFMGRWYPPLICALVLLGHLFGLEMLTNTAIILLTTLSLLVCRTTRPVIVVACTYLFQLSREHTPALPTYSDYCFSSWRLPLVVALFVIVALAIAFFAVKRKIFAGVTFRNTRLLLPLLIFMAALIAGGAFSAEWSWANFAFGVLQAFTFGFFFILFLLGLRGESLEDMAEYFAYVSALTVLLLLGEVGGLYLTSDTLYTAEGEVIKGQILFGWGVWNSMGVALAQLIPVCFIGVIRSKYSWLYFGASVLCLGGIILTQSRNALLFGLLAFAACVVLCAFVGRYKIAYRVMTALGAVGVIAAAILMRERLPELIGGFFSDNGRYTIWEIGINNFLDSPVFGKGFFGFEFPDDPNYFVGADFLPGFVHQTFIQLLSATGAIGLLAYLFYRLSTVMAVVRRPSVNKSLLFGSALVMLLMSQLDTFLFNFWPVIHYSVVIGIIYLGDSNTKEEKTI